MEACCPLCYAYYINEDGTIDREAYETARLARLVQPRKRKYQRTPEEQARLEQRLQPLLPDGVPCMCDCHVKNTKVLH